MKTIKTSKLVGAALDWAVAKCEVGEPVGSFLDGVVAHPSYNNFRPSADWAQGGPIIEREGINILFQGVAHDWVASLWSYKLEDWYLHTEGPAPLIAAMRCYVANKLGDEVEIPDAIVGGEQQ